MFVHRCRALVSGFVERLRATHDTGQAFLFTTASEQALYRHGSQEAADGHLGVRLEDVTVSG
jgi:putative SOS response-associated peptidase YedK